MITAEVGETKAQGAVMATRPASMPLQAMVMSGLPNRKYQRSMAAADPATRREVGVDGDDGDAKVGCAQG